jgi:hypothetical protein
VSPRHKSVHGVQTMRLDQYALLRLVAERVERLPKFLA